MAAQSDPVVSMRGIDKRFLDTVANSDVDFELRRGEICALLGENGAGKTTLMNILFGYYSADAGVIRVGGEKVHFTAPKDAIRAGIGMIHQHFTLVPAHTVLENIIIGAADPGFFIDQHASQRRVLELQERFGLRVDPNRRVSELSVGEQQKVEILKALYRNSQILIMDEPTAVLGLAESHELFATLRTLAAEGRSVVFISHKLNEVTEISDRVVVLRHGKVVGERRTAQTSAAELATLMVGRELLERLERPTVQPGSEALVVQDLTIADMHGGHVVARLSFSVRSREIVGIAGVSGNGQRELCDVLFGLTTPLSGHVTLAGTALRFGNPGAAVRLGIARIPEDRMGTGLLLELSVAENLILEHHTDYAPRRLFNRAAVTRRAGQLIDEYSVKTTGPTEPAKNLSGGNLQKLILARELAGEPTLVVASQPTRGLDVGAMEYLHARILEQKARGAAVLIVSDDLDEVLNLSDRIITIYEGRIMGETTAAAADRERIGLWMSGVEA